MNAVGIDVSKGKSTVTVLQPFEVVVAEPFNVSHNAQELKELAERLKLLSGETKVVMEYTGKYHGPAMHSITQVYLFPQSMQFGYTTMAGTQSEMSRLIRKTL